MTSLPPGSSTRRARWTRLMPGVCALAPASPTRISIGPSAVKMSAWSVEPSTRSEPGTTVDVRTRASFPLAASCASLSRRSHKYSPSASGVPRSVHERSAASGKKSSAEACAMICRAGHRSTVTISAALSRPAVKMTFDLRTESPEMVRRIAKKSFGYVSENCASSNVCSSAASTGSAVSVSSAAVAGAPRLLCTNATATAAAMPSRRATPRRLVGFVCG
mmetsp:Transcript_23517/g.93215  ORF Transcript_23517/g.93215 Transcript_23517/m.93215 type:complete len:220 (+) Transcript_23517:295-954(+)